MSTTLTIDRTALSLSDLTIVGTRAAATTGAGYWLPETGSDTLVPTFQPRRLYAPDSAWVAGKRLLGAVLDQGTITTAVRVIGSSWSTLQTRKTALETALYQFAYTVTLTIDGSVLGAWDADPAWLTWATPTPLDRVDFTASAALQIPVNP